ncbi:Crp/Fnr family transcriptional regulator [Sphingobacterium detergens]|uniref:CRP-like cAMP-binding protein n=1 Tax=Sphingobacterium detergens TaxID=1145106 RepID=A0A420BKJ8_SPHD1|nr:Crp/Fnr family transcriptional regulator [Sphingobacterium detergens]RKE57311.1 CRP-like cAMP-binding protein [Sphingobacterium detergens]
MVRHKHQGLIDNITRYVDLNDIEKEEICKVFQYVKVNNGEIVSHPGNICKYQHFVLSGCLKLFYSAIDGKDHILYFLPEQWWASDLYSYFNQYPSEMMIQAVIDTEILQIEKKNFDKLLKEFPVFESFFRIIYQNALCAQHKKTIETLTLSARERYLNFMESFPMLIQQVPLKDIASYLGITPEHLSRLRSQIVKK